MTIKSEQEFEKDIQKKGLTANRLTPDDISDLIESSQYHVFKGTTTTVCCLTLSNGFTVIGESACVDPDNFDKGIGEEIAYNEARQKIWSLEGYLLNFKNNMVKEVMGCVEDMVKDVNAMTGKSDDDGMARDKDKFVRKIKLPKAVIADIRKNFGKAGTECFLERDGERLLVVDIGKKSVTAIPVDACDES